MKNKKSIIIFFEASNHTPLVKSLITNMRQKGITIDAWDAYSWRYINPVLNENSLFNHNSYSMLFSILRVLLKIPKLRTILRNSITHLILKKISNRYDLIDIHFFSPSYFKLLDQLILQNKSYKITIWGSDFYRAPLKRREIQKKYYINAEMIQCETKEVQEEFLKYLPSVANKIRIARFGIYQLQYIDKTIYSSDSLSLLPCDLYENKIIITCGYNASKGQQHEKIITALQELEPEQKSKIFLLFPMTYGVQKGYLKYIETLLRRTKISYHIFSIHLSHRENAELKILTDIVVNIQITDTLSASLQEHLYAKNILLVGEWLPYKIFDENGIFYMKTSCEKLSENISYCIDNLDVLKQKTKNNYMKIKSLSSWDFVSRDWLKIYNELLNW